MNTTNRDSKLNCGRQDTCGFTTRIFPNHGGNHTPFRRGLKQEQEQKIAIPFTSPWTTARVKKDRNIKHHELGSFSSWKKSTRSTFLSKTTDTESPTDRCRYISQYQQTMMKTCNSPVIEDEIYPSEGIPPLTDDNSSKKWPSPREDFIYDSAPVSSASQKLTIQGNTGRPVEFKSNLYSPNVNTRKQLYCDSLQKSESIPRTKEFGKDDQTATGITPTHIAIRKLGVVPLLGSSRRSSSKFLGRRKSADNDNSKNVVNHPSAKPWNSEKIEKSRYHKKMQLVDKVPQMVYTRDWKSADDDEVSELYDLPWIDDPECMLDVTLDVLRYIFEDIDKDSIHGIRCDGSDGCICRKKATETYSFVGTDYSPSSYEALYANSE